MGANRSHSGALVVMVMLALLASPLASAWRIDCTRFVFAPRCRGVAAKRGDSNSLSPKQQAGLDDVNAQALQTAMADPQRADPASFLQLLMALSPAMNRPAPLAQRRKDSLDEYLTS